MTAEIPIGDLIPTKIPGYSDDADIQAALRLYHYGSYTYSPSNTSPANLISPSIAKTIYDIEQDILTLDAGTIQNDIFTAKGQILTATAANSPAVLTLGNNNQFLVANNATATGLQWTNTLASPIISGLTLSDANIIFEGTTADEFETTLTVVDPTADRTITLPNISGTVVTTGDTGTVTSTMIANDTIVNADISTSAAIAYSKLSLSNSIVNADISTSAAIANSKLANSTISGIALGSNLNALTIGTGLSGTSYNGSSAVTIAIDSTVVTLSGTQTLTNKTLTTPIISSISNIGTLTLPTSTDTLVGRATTDTLSNKSIALGSNTVTGTIAQFNIALTDADFATIAGTETLTNKTLTTPQINLGTPNAQTGTTFTPVLSDNGKIITLDNVSSITVTVPTNTNVAYATGAQINIVQLGTGQVTVNGDTGVTVYSTPGNKFRAQYSAATLIKLDTNTWLLTGDLSI